MSRLTKLAIIGLAILYASLSHGQQSPATAQIERDQSALSAVAQAINAAGGVDAISAVQGVVGTGTITYYQGVQSTGTVIVKGLGANQFRLDVTLPNGVRTAIAQGTGEVVRDTDGAMYPMSSTCATSESSLLFPYFPLLAALNNPAVSFVDLGQVDHGALSLRDIRTQRIFTDGSDPQGYLGAQTTRDYLLDTTSFQIVAIMDTPTVASAVQGTPSFTHEIDLSNFQVVNGILTPFSTSELLNGQQLSAIAFTNVSLNPTFTDTDFAFQ